MKAIVVSSLALFLCVGEVGQARASDDWVRRDSASGTVFYDCVSDSCDRGSLLSCHMQAANRFSTLEEYERWRVSRFAAMRASGITVEVGKAARGALGDRVLYQDGFVTGLRNGGSQSHRSGFLVGKAASVSIESSSSSASAASRNFAELVARLAAHPLDFSRVGCTPTKSSNRQAAERGRVRRNP